MHPTVHATFRDIVQRLRIHGRILEIGAVPSNDSLLALDLLEGTERIGVNIEGNVNFGGFEIVEANSNDMSMFPDAHFDCVLSNATIEHDPFFWKTCSEVRRVLRVGGISIVGAPGFTVESGLKMLGVQSPFPEDQAESWVTSALTFRFHAAPNDYYRFSPSAIREVLFEGFADVTIKSVMMPPRIIAYGFRL